MPETLMTPSSIKMYGRLLKSLQFKNDTFPFGGDYFLQRQLSAFGTITITATTVAGNATVTVNSTSGLAVGQGVTGDPAIIPAGATIAAIGAPPAKTFDLSVPAAAAAQNIVIIVNTGPASFARIYAFSFEGAIYTLPRPALFLVHGTGIPVDADSWHGNRSSLDESGVIAREWEFSGDKKDLSYWEYEKGDFSVRLDTDAGPLEQILLVAALRGADMADRSGASLSGASLGVRSGASLNGASLSGASLAGASLSGASLRNR